MAKSAGSDTPMMQQHRAIKQKYPDAILLFRVGDFYETFGADAITASRVLGITLTRRNNGAAAESELAGFPHHALDTYLHKLVKAGHRVAICDQLEDPKLAKGVVKRGVTDMVTPGTTVNDKLLEHHSNNFLAAVHFAGDDRLGLSFLDISTGEFLVAEGNREYADKLLQGFRPAEVLFERRQQKRYKDQFGSKNYTYTLDEWIFDPTYAQDILLKHFQTHSLKGFGVDGLTDGLTAAGAILHYLRETEHPNLRHIVSLHRIERDDFLWMDRFTIRNLELVQAQADGEPTLLSVLDQTHSPMGARLLKRWIIFPLRDPGKIRERLDTVDYLLKDTDRRLHLQQLIKPCGDLERLVSKIPLKKINPREVLQLGRSLRQTDAIRQCCLESANDHLRRIGDALNPCPLIAEKILREINENPPAQLNKGGVIAGGVREDLDNLRRIAYNGKEYLTQLQQQESLRTGIPSLKIGFNNVFGYYLEVTHAHRDKVPADWIRKQTLTNAERYITPELKEYEETITGAEEKILQLEAAHFDSLIAELAEYLAPVQNNGQLLAVLDVLCCFAQLALQYGYKKPELHLGDEWVVAGGRHPVIERVLPPGEPYIDNDLELNGTDQQLIILTGPNMSGKSALLRQTALITLMAHMGSFVPAATARIPLTDKIFTRVGASDNVSGGESTFMVEMNETASILNNLTGRSLVLLDEIGRGTSTYDGISIAWSIAEYLHESPHRPKTLFATHYHELNELESQFPRIRNYHITNKESGNRIIFLRKLARGGSTHSFGIHVARMAGMPPSLTDRASIILQTLEANRHPGNAAPATGGIVPDKNGRLQLSIFDSHSEAFAGIRSLLDGTDINRLTPVEALLKLQEIKNRLK